MQNVSEYSLVLGVFDYCNVLLIGLPAIKLAELTYLQRYAVRIIHKLPHREENNHISITQLMKELHWLPIKERIIYKICLMTHNALHFETPSYLYELIEIIDQTRSLRPCHVNRIRPIGLRSIDRQYILLLPVHAPSRHKHR